MPPMTRTLQASCMSMLLMSGAAFAQEACKTYTVKAGDNLRNIARAAYGQPDFYRIIYEANVAVIGRKADLIEIGMPLDIPCNPLATPIASAQTAAAPAAEPLTAASTVAPEPQADVKPLALVTGNDFAPYADETLPGGGMFTQLMEMAIFRSDPETAYNLTFINDRQAHIDALLPSQAYDISFPWTRPNCEAPETLSTGDKNRCDNFTFSAPFLEVVEGFFTKSGSDLLLATHYDDLVGKKICIPEGFSTNTLDEVGLGEGSSEILRPVLVENCLNALVQGNVDLVVMNADAAESAISRLGITGQVDENPYLSRITTLHAIAHKSNQRAIDALEMLNNGITEMYASGEWYDVVSAALSREKLHK
ncbi:MAG: transporter substrate-binding domain-containing protein [Rhodobacteraceae bacterium]|nr:transporter substrate-binding domain-containing protein [Paracoccaceae bacterium]